MIELIDRPSWTYCAPALRIPPASGLFGMLKPHFRSVRACEICPEWFQHLTLDRREFREDISLTKAA
jgi:hypothetical protein